MSEKLYEEILSLIEEKLTSTRLLPSGSKRTNVLLNEKYVLRKTNTAEKEFLMRTKGFFGPNVYTHKNEYILEEYISGAHPKNYLQIEEELAIFFSQLHAQEYDKKQFTLTFREQEEILPLIKQVKKLFKTLPEQPLVYTHNDVSLTNIMCEQEKIRLIDWEHVRLAPKEYELAGIQYKYYFAKKEFSSFIEQYALTVDEETLEKLFFIKRVEQLSNLIDRKEKILLGNIDPSLRFTNIQPIEQRIKQEKEKLFSLI